MLKLHDYQHRAIAQIMEHKSVFLMADIGMGKTTIALNAIAKVKMPTIVMAPLAVCYSTWPDEIKKWTPHLTYTILHGKDKERNLKLKRDIYLINYDGLKWFFKACHDKKFPLKRYFMVWDESSFVKNPSTQRFKLLKKMFGIFSPYRLCLSATPMPNGLQELWSQVFLLDRGKRLGGSYYRFRDRYFHYSGAPLYKLWPRESAEEKIHDAIRHISFRLDARDYLTLPDISYNPITIKLSAKTQKQYDDLERNMFLEVGQTIINPVNAASLTMKLRQFVQGFMYNEEGNGGEVHWERPKALMKLVEGAAGNPILASVQFKHEVKMIRKVMGYNVPLIAGGVSAREKKAHIDDWNSGILPLLLCHPASLGHGVNLQAGGHVLLWYANTWSQDHFKQLNGRLFRQGQQKGVVVNQFRIPDTVDDLMIAVVKNKDKTQQSFLDAVREYARRKGLWQE